MASRSKRWCFTEQAPIPPQWNSDIMEYMCYQKEIAPQTGKEHFQGYIRLKNRTRLGKLKEISASAHWEVAKGNEKENRDYCTKAESRLEPPQEYGTYDEKEGQGKRSDLQLIAEQIIQGVSTKELARKYPSQYILHAQGMERLALTVQEPPPLISPREVIVMWGTTGSGKSYRAAHRFPDAYWVRPGRNPWDNYAGQTVVIFDEFSWKVWSIQDMNMYLDEYRVELQCRYMNKYARWHTAVIIANTPVQTWWPEEETELRAAFARRANNGLIYEVINWSEDRVTGNQEKINNIHTSP